MSNLSAQSTKISCPNCGAAVDLNPEDVVVICPYCGSAFTRAQQEIKDHKIVPPSYSKAEAEKKIFEWIRKKTRFRGTGTVQAIKVEKILVPFWVMASSVETHYVGYRQTTREETGGTFSSGGKEQRTTRTITVYEPVDKIIREERNDPLLCRMGATIFGIKEINEAVKKVVKYGVYEDFNVEKLKDRPEEISFLSGEIKQSEAKEIIETSIQDEHRAKARADTTELFDCRTKITVKGMDFLHYPIVYVEYVHGRETYRVVMDGYNGQILAAEIPITTRFRLIAEMGAVFSLLGIFVLSFPLYNQLAEEQFGFWGFVYGVFAGFLLLLGMKANATAWSTESRTKEKLKKPLFSLLRKTQGGDNNE